MKKYKKKKVVNITGLLVLAQALMQRVTVAITCPKCNQEVPESAFDKATNQCTRCKRKSPTFNINKIRGRNKNERCN